MRDSSRPSLQLIVQLSNTSILHVGYVLDTFNKFGPLKILLDDLELLHVVKSDSLLVPSCRNGH